MDVDVVLVEKLVRQAIEEVKNKNLLNLDKVDSTKNYGIFENYGCGS